MKQTRGKKSFEVKSELILLNVAELTDILIPRLWTPASGALFHHGQCDWRCAVI